MSNPENPATALEEDLSDPRQFIVKYEVEKYRLITEDDMVIVGFSGSGAVVGGLIADSALYKDQSLVMTPLNAAGHVVSSTAKHMRTTIGNLTGLAGSHAHSAYIPEQTVETAQAGTPPPEHISLGLQAGMFVGTVAFVTFALASTYSAWRYRSTQRRKNFKSSISYEELEKMWDGDTDDASAV